MAGAAMPSTASTRPSQTRAGSLTPAPLLAGRDLLQFLAELGEHLGAVHALGVGRFDPLDVKLLRPGHDFLDEGGRRGLDLRAGGPEAGKAELVGAVPGLAVGARRGLAGALLDDVLVLLGGLVPLVLVHEAAERGAVEAARKDGRALDHLVELER